MNDKPTVLNEAQLIRLSLAELEFPKVLERVASYCISELGREIILASGPTEDTDWLREEHERVDEIVRMYYTDRHLPLDGLSDIRSLLQKSLVQNNFLNPAELLAVRDVLRASRLVRNYVAEHAEEAPVLDSFTAGLASNRLLEKHIQDALDENGTVRDSASRELARIRRDILDTSNRLRQRLQKLLKKVKEEDVVSDDYISQRDGRFVLPMKTEYKRYIPGIIHGVSNTGATVFLEPAETFELNNEISLLYGEEQREIVKILTILTAELAEVAREFMRSVEILGHLDASIARARYACNYNGQKPAIVDENEIVLHNIRHPLLVQAKGNTDVVPLSVEFRKGVMGHLVSGPNAGGKTVALKSIGLNVAMALSGIFPLGECSTNYRSIFTAIGDNQSIENDVSTFSSQIIRLREILTNCSNVALVLVDEICSGTDPGEGSALAVGIIEGFLARSAFFIVTTHQTSLKSYALTRTELSNASMEFDGAKLIPTYRFLSGVPGNSYAFALAASLNMPPAVMARAREYLGDKHSTLEESIEVIQRTRRDAEALRNEAVEAKSRAELARADYEQRFKEFKAKYGQLLTAAREEAAKVVSDANRLVENTIREIREEKRAASEVKAEFSEQKKKIVKAAEQQTHMLQTSESYTEGDVVVMEGFEMPGVVIAVDADSSSAVVEFDSVKFKTTFSKLQRSDKKVKGPAKPALEFRMDAAHRLDLRGMYADQATLEVENAIADAMLSSIQEMTLVHGKGTGALRKALQRFLKQHPAVRAFREGSLAEGGAGVTIVELK